MIRKDSQEKFSYVILQKRPRHSTHTSSSSSSLSVSAVDPKKHFGVWTEESSKVDEAAKGQDPSPLNVLQRFVDVEEEDVQEVVDKLIDEVQYT